MGYLDELLGLSRLYRPTGGTGDLAGNLQKANAPKPPDYVQQLQQSGQGTPYPNETAALTAQAKQAQQAYAMPPANPADIVPTGSITADRAANPIDRYVTDSDYVRSLSPEAQKLVGRASDAVLGPLRAAYETPGAVARGDWLGAAGNVVEAAPTGKIAGAALKGGAALAKGAGAASHAILMPVGVAGTNWGAVQRADRMFKKGINTADPVALHKDVWRDTGIGYMPEGKRMFEVNDQGLQFDPKRGWTHPELFQADPYTQTLQVGGYRDPTSTTGGAYYPGSNPPQIDINLASKEDPRSILAHEIAHPLQERYGLSQGSNPRMAMTPEEQAYEYQMKQNFIANGASAADVAKVPPGWLRYLGSAGEDAARNNQNRLGLDVMGRRDLHPAETSDLYLGTTGPPGRKQDIPIMPRLIYEGQRGLRQSKMADQLHALWDIYGYTPKGGGP